MTFDKHYPNRKDHRKQYYGSARFDRSCRPGGDCPYCKENRFHSESVRKERADYILNEYFEENNDE